VRYKRNITGADVALEVLQVPGCPGADRLAARLRPACRASRYPCGAGGMPSATSIAFSDRTESQ
jgi:hypothetical protein